MNNPEQTPVQFAEWPDDGLDDKVTVKSDWDSGPYGWWDVIDPDAPRLPGSIDSSSRLTEIPRVVFENYERAKEALGVAEGLIQGYEDRAEAAEHRATTGHGAPAPDLKSYPDGSYSRCPDCKRVWLTQNLLGEPTREQLRALRPWPAGQWEQGVR